MWRTAASKKSQRRSTIPPKRTGEVVRRLGLGHVDDLEPISLRSLVNTKTNRTTHATDHNDATTLFHALGSFASAEPGAHDVNVHELLSSAWGDTARNPPTFLTLSVGYSRATKFSTIPAAVTKDYHVRTLEHAVTTHVNPAPLLLDLFECPLNACFVGNIATVALGSDLSGLRLAVSN